VYFCLWALWRFHSLCIFAYKHTGKQEIRAAYTHLLLSSFFVCCLSVPVISHCSWLHFTPPFVAPTTGIYSEPTHMCHKLLLQIFICQESGREHPLSLAWVSYERECWRFRFCSTFLPVCVGAGHKLCTKLQLFPLKRDLPHVGAVSSQLTAQSLVIKRRQESFQDFRWELKRCKSGRTIESFQQKFN